MNLAKRDKRIGQLLKELRLNREKLLSNLPTVSASNDPCVEVAKERYQCHCQTLGKEREAQHTQMMAIVSYLDEIIGAGDVDSGLAIRAQWGKNQVLDKATQIQAELEKINKALS